MMTGFRLFIEMAGVHSELRDTLAKLPKGHRALTKGYKFKFEDGCTLKGEKDAIGMIHLNNDKKKEIHVAAPWRYGREFALLHEIAHLVFEKWMANNSEWKKKWQKIVNKTKKKLNQPAEELWCHAYSNHFCKNKIEIHNHPEWEEFMTEFCKKFK
jgi:hypothetical protein